MKINKNIIKELSDYLDEFNLTEIEYTEKDLKVKVSKINGISSSPVITNTSKPKLEIEIASLCVHCPQFYIYIYATSYFILLHRVKALHIHIRIFS